MSLFSLHAFCMRVYFTTVYILPNKKNQLPRLTVGMNFLLPRRFRSNRSLLILLIFLLHLIPSLFPHHSFLASNGKLISMESSGSSMLVPYSQNDFGQQVNGVPVGFPTQIDRKMNEGIERFMLGGLLGGNHKIM